MGLPKVRNIRPSPNRRRPRYDEPCDSGSSGLAIGQPLSGGSTGCILYVSSSGTLTESSQLSYQAASATLIVSYASSHSGNIRLVCIGGGSVQLSAPASAGAAIVFVLPSADGSSGQLLQTDGAGNLSWTNPGGGIGPAGSSGDIQVNNGSGGFNPLGYSFVGTSSATYTLPGSSDTLIGNSDSRLSDARTPTTHGSSHDAAGSDPLGSTAYTAGNSSDWNSGAPGDVWSALNRIAAVLNANSMAP